MLHDSTRKSEKVGSTSLGLVLCARHYFVCVTITMTRRETSKLLEALNMDFSGKVEQTLTAA